MDLPLCKICGERHRLGFCPKFGDPASERRRWLRAMTGPAGEPVATVAPKPALQKPAIPVMDEEIPDAPETAGAPQVEQHHQTQEAEKEAPPQVMPEAKPRFDKKAYQRDLMRKRRAQERAAKEQVMS